MTTAKLQSICDSWWMKSEPVQQGFDSLSGPHSTEILIIGAGITGLSTAIELTDRGHRVTVCEAEAIGCGTTLGSTGHLDAHPESGPRALVEKLGADDAVVYTAMRLAAIDVIEKRAQDQADFVRVSAYQYSEDYCKESSLRDDLVAAREIGLQATWCENVPIPRAVYGTRLQTWRDSIVQNIYECLGHGKKNVWVATGLSGVGLTLGTAAATILADGIEGKPMSLERALSPNRMALSKDWIAEQATATVNMAEQDGQRVKSRLKILMTVKVALVRSMESTLRFVATWTAASIGLTPFVHTWVASFTGMKRSKHGTARCTAVGSQPMANESTAHPNRI